MFKKLGQLFATALGLILLVYSATRSLDFISMTLPADRQILAWFGLAALDGGLLAWLLSYLYGSRGGWQRAISIIMVVIDLLGAVAMFTLDTLYQTGQSGMTAALTADEMQTAVLGLSGIIALNISATVAHHLTDPDKLKEQAEEEAFSKVEDATLKQISENADQLAAQVAPMLAADWMQNSRARYLANLGTGRIPTIDATARDVDKAPALPRINVDKPAFNVASLWPGIFAKNGNGAHKFNFNTVAPEGLAESEVKNAGENPSPFLGD